MGNGSARRKVSRLARPCVHTGPCRHVLDRSSPLGCLREARCRVHGHAAAAQGATRPSWRQCHAWRSVASSFSLTGTCSKCTPTQDPALVTMLRLWWGDLASAGARFKRCQTPPAWRRDLSPVALPTACASRATRSGASSRNCLPRGPPAVSCRTLLGPRGAAIAALAAPTRRGGLKVGTSTTLQRSGTIDGCLMRGGWSEVGGLYVWAEVRV